MGPKHWRVLLGSLTYTFSLPTVLDFAALHRIKPVVQTYPMTEEGIKEAMDKLDRGEVRYRAVLVPQ